jgi:hypothetical protein
MPSARDPAVYRHPRYEAVARRGRAAGVGIVLAYVLVITLSLTFVRL